MNKTQMIKRAYVRGLAARGIYRARLRQKQAAGGLKNYAISGGIGAAGGGALGSLIGALVQYARGKNVLRGALAGGGIGGGLGLLGGLGYQYFKKGPNALPVSKDYSVYSSNDPSALLGEKQYPNLSAVANIVAGDGQPTTGAPSYADLDAMTALHLLGGDASTADLSKVEQMSNANTGRPDNGDGYNPNNMSETERQDLLAEYADANNPGLNWRDLKGVGGSVLSWAKNKMPNENELLLHLTARRNQSTSNGGATPFSKQDAALLNLLEKRDRSRREKVLLKQQQNENSRKARENSKRVVQNNRRFKQENDRKEWEKGVKENEDTGRGKMGY